MNSAGEFVSFFVADWLVDPRSNSITRGEESKRVEPKAMRVLTLLAANAGQVVTRHELEDEIWTDMIVGPDSLTNTVIKLRRALGDDAKNAAIIETIPKTGYRLIAPVREAEEGETEPSLERRLSAILYADVAEYSRLTGEDEERTHRILSANLDLFSEAVRIHNGKVVHYAGDALLAEFSTVTAALSCAVEVQRELREQDDSQPQNPSVQFRIGINLGEVIVDRDDIYGDGVNIAARLEGLADTGGICISESVYSAVGNKLSLDYEFMGEQLVKNIAEPVRAYRVLFDPRSRQAKKARRSPAKIVLSAVALAAAIVGLILLWPQFSIHVGDEEQESVTTSPGKPTIAVLPFANASVDVSEGLRARGITRDIITDLAKISGVDVIAYRSVLHYENQEIDVREIGRELGAQFIVEGSISRAGDRVRINVQLIEAARGVHRWAERYDRNFNEFFALQDDVVFQVVSEISVEVTDSESAQIERLPTTNLEAYDYYFRAEQAGFIDGGTGLVDTMKLYEKAIDLDPEFAEAHAGRARAAVAAWRSDIGQVITGAKARADAYESASRALEIDPKNGQAYSVLAVMQLADGQYQAAIESAHKAVKLGPGSAQAHLDLGLVLAYSGEPKEGVVEIETVFRLNPNPTPDTHFYAGIVFFIDHQYQRALESFSKARPGLQGSDSLWAYLAATHGLLGQKEEAALAVIGLLENYPNLSVEYYRARDYYFRRPEDFERYLQGMKLAGLSNWPYNFQGTESDRLKGAVLLDLVEGKTWVGEHLNGGEFYQQVTSSGGLAYRSENSFQTGTATIEGDKLCQRFDSTLNRKMCGYVYHDPDQAGNSEERYIVVMPDSLRYFSITP